jgi:hypothetical protein
MDSLPINTKHRLQRIPQIPHVWEGDRLPIAGVMDNLEPDLVKNGQCIIWVDGSEGFVRSMEVVRSNAGLEAMVRSLLKAIETPHSPAQPARPQKIVVKNRELQFFLRGALQDLDIQVDYQTELPLLDELWQNFQSINQVNDLGEIRPELMADLKEIALTRIWIQQPWDFLAESDIIKIEINSYNVETVYACIMGMMGQEFGVILYRSLDSLKKFRQLAISMREETSEIEIESAFLNQDCWFINFVPFDDEEEDEDLLADTVPQLIFGSIHPYEGIRPLRDEEELIPVCLALEALGQFITDYETELEIEPIPLLSGDYQIPIAFEKTSIKIKVSTVPELTTELEEMFDEYEFDDDDDDDDDFDDFDDDDFVLTADLTPEGSIVSFSMLSADLLNTLYHQTFTTVLTQDLSRETVKNIKKHELPCIMLQTSRPKAKIIIEKLTREGGIDYILFNKGLVQDSSLDFELGILQTNKGEFHLFCQFAEANESFQQEFAQWKKQVSLVKNYCAFVVAMGVTGLSKGNPKAKDILGVFFAEFTQAKEVGLPEVLYS